MRPRSFSPRRVVDPRHVPGPTFVDRVETAMLLVVLGCFGLGALCAVGIMHIVGNGRCP